MKYLNRLCIFLSIIICSEDLFGQIQHPTISRAAYNAALEAELSHSERDRYLYKHADAYSRLMELRIFKQLGYDLTKSDAVDPLFSSKFQ